MRNNRNIFAKSGENDGKKRFGYKMNLSDETTHSPCNETLRFEITTPRSQKRIVMYRVPADLEELLRILWGILEVPQKL